MTQRSRNRSLLRFAPALLLAAALVPTGRALALERGGYSMEILVGGTPLRELAARGTTYIEALRNRDYSIRLHNGTGERVGIALSVDGLNSIDARTTTALDARKWILGPYETITLDGWQTSATTARRFVFTTEERSYGNWLGRTQNLGLIAAAVFRERRPQPIVSGGYEERMAPRQGSKDEAGAPAPGAESAPPEAPEPRSGVLAPRKETSRPRPGDLAATGIGQETSHPVVQVVFDEEDSPAAVLEVRYEYRDALVRLGVFPPDDWRRDALDRRESARGFEDPGFAPDPYRRRDR